MTISALDSFVKNISVSIQFADVKFPNDSTATNDPFKVFLSQQLKAVHD